MISTERQGSRVESLVKACRLIGRMSRLNPLARQSDIKYYQLLEKYYSRVLRAREEGGFLASHTVFFPTEVLYAMDIIPMHTELTTWLAAEFLGAQSEVLAAGAELGLAPEICSPHRGLAGAFKINALPRPDVVLWSNLICDNTAKSGELIAEINRRPGFFLDHPFQDSKLEIKYFVSELQELVRFLEERSGHKMNWDKLSESIVRTNREIELLHEICELRKAIPSPFHALGFLELLSVDYLFPGQPEAVEYLEAVHKELSDMVKQGKGAVKEEKHRLMTLFVPPMHMIGFLERLYQEHGAVSTVEPLFTYWNNDRLDPSRPLESVARKADLIPERRTMYGPLTDKVLKETADHAKQYKVDGAVYWAFMGCRHTCATIKLFKDTLAEINVPMVTIDCDLVDPTINSEEEIREALERFFEQLSKPHVKATAGTHVLVAGVDIGSVTTKAVIINGDRVLGTSIIASADDAEAGAKAAIKEALERAGIRSNPDLCVVSTGVGGKGLSFSKGHKTAATCLAMGAHYLYHSVRTVIDIGGESCTVVKVDEGGHLTDSINHDKCAAGTGLFLQQMARLMAMTLPEVSSLSLQAQGRADISGTCAVFAESEVISHVHRDPPTPKADIAAGIHYAVAGRLASLCKRVGIEKDVLVVGGVALNAGLVAILEEELSIKVLVPESPQTVAALGAALAASEGTGSD
ncbi:MAG: 2-hydroxyacyl-CoA dehydratase [Chloroflexi bacterium]|nr:2-hydroxyacyl-CoA dehydratase [Chloroflexota bacterium]